jgi:hypothetical protein
VSPVDEARGYGSPDHVPGSWVPDRPGEIHGFQPSGQQLGFQGPDQGFGIKLANTFRSKIRVSSGELVDDALSGCLGIGLRRASMFSRAPVIHDFTVAFTAWGFLDSTPSDDLVSARQPLFEGLANIAHHYREARCLVDMMPESTLEMSPQQVTAAYPGRWRELVGA